MEDFNRIYGITFSTVVVTLVLFTVTGVFGAIRIHGALAIVVGSVAGLDSVLLLLMLEIFANVSFSSVKSVKNMKRDLIDKYGNGEHVEKRELKRVWRMGPVQIRILVVCKVVQVSVLTIARILAENTAALLITL